MKSLAIVETVEGTEGDGVDWAEGLGIEALADVACALPLGGWLGFGAAGVLMSAVRLDGLDVVVLDGAERWVARLMTAAGHLLALDFRTDDRIVFWIAAATDLGR